MRDRLVLTLSSLTIQVPSLTRRFTLLRSSSGDPLTLDDLRSKFAEQRVRGVPNQISEEEEDMILETLGRMRTKNAALSTTSSSKLEGDSGANATDLGMESDYTHERTLIYPPRPLRPHTRLHLLLLPRRRVRVQRRGTATIFLHLDGFASTAISALCRKEAAAVVAQLL